jgi:hypothetical protein
MNSGHFTRKAAPASSSRSGRSELVTASVTERLEGGSRLFHTGHPPDEALVQQLPPRALGDRSSIPDRHSEDLLVGVRVEGFDRQSAFRARDTKTSLLGVVVPFGLLDQASHSPGELRPSLSPTG